MAPQGSSESRYSGGWYLVVMFLGQMVSMAYFWSWFMSMCTQESFMSYLVPGGVSLGLTMGILMTVVGAIQCRPYPENSSDGA